MRARRPTEETGTDVYDPEQPLGGTAGAGAESWDHDATEVSAQSPAQLEPPTEPDAGAAHIATSDQPTPTELPAGLERGEPIRVISMKERAGAATRPDDERVPLRVQLRTIAEVAGPREPALGLGHLAPPRDPRQARARRQRANALWACVAVALACGISLGIWLIAGR